MSMSSDPENFDSLRRLLALKRHEVPPPGYFNRFSSQVIARIESGALGEQGSRWQLWFNGVAGWLHGFWRTFESKPIFAGALGVGACALVLVGALSSPNEASSTNLPQLPKGPFTLTASTPALGEQAF